MRGDPAVQNLASSLRGAAGSKDDRRPYLAAEPVQERLRERPDDDRNVLADAAPVTVVPPLHVAGVAAGTRRLRGSPSRPFTK